MSQVDRILSLRTSVDESELEAVRARTIARLAAVVEPSAEAVPVDPTSVPPTRDPTRGLRRAAPAPRRATAARRPGPAYCPYCAIELDPPPTTDRRCARCRRRIVVRDVDGRLVHLTEAAVVVFEAERIKALNIERWTAERKAWLELAGANGARPARIERMARSPAESTDAVVKARAFFVSTVDHAVDEALRHDRWEVAARLRRDQANGARRIAGAAAPPTDEMVDLYRDAARLELRGIATMARSAVIVGSRCCEACRADDGTVSRLAGELRRSRLPHAECPRVLCGCRWELAPRAVVLVERYLERTGRRTATAASAPS